MKIISDAGTEAAMARAARSTPPQRPTRRTIDPEALIEARRVWRGVQPRMFRETVAHYGPECIACGATATTVDHVTPLSQGGSPTRLDNCRPMCGSCNSRRGDRPLVEFVRQVRAEQQDNGTRDRRNRQPSRNWFGT